MSHSESPKNVKKTQAVRSQLFITFSYFAHTRPLDFYFGKPTVISYNKCYFVSIIQRLQEKPLLPPPKGEGCVVEGCCVLEVMFYFSSGLVMSRYCLGVIPMASCIFRLSVLTVLNPASCAMASML